MQTRTEKPLSPESYAKVVFTSEQLRLAHYHCMVNYIVYYIASRVEVRDSSKLRFPSWIPLGYHSHIKKSSPKLEVFWWAHQHGIANAGSNRFLYAGLLSGRRLSLLDARLVVGGWVWDGAVKILGHQIWMSWISAIYRVWEIYKLILCRAWEI